MTTSVIRIQEPTDVQDGRTRDYLQRLVRDLLMNFEDLNRDRQTLSTQSITSSGTSAINPFVEIVLVNATSGNITLQLPAVSDKVNQSLFVKRTDSSGNTVNLSPVGVGVTIDNSGSALSVAALAGYLLFCNGEDWFILCKT